MRFPSILVVAAVSALAEWTAFAQRPEFEVASVKISAGGDFGFRPIRTSNRVSIHNTHIASVITYACDIPFYRLVGYEKSSIAYEWYDVDAKVKPEATGQQVRLMFLALLEDRFQFKCHRETRELPRYELTLAKGKAKMTPASDDELMKVEIEGKHTSRRKGGCGNSAWLDGNHLTCHAAPMAKIASLIEAELGAPVADLTGLTGVFDLDVRFASSSQKTRDDAEPAPSLAAALQLELGLKLEKGKGPVEVVVIDRIEKPTEN